MRKCVGERNVLMSVSEKEEKKAERGGARGPARGSTEELC